MWPSGHNQIFTTTDHLFLRVSRNVSASIPNFLKLRIMQAHWRKISLNYQGGVFKFSYYFKLKSWSLFQAHTINLFFQKKKKKRKKFYSLPQNSGRCPFPRCIAFVCGCRSIKQLSSNGKIIDSPVSTTHVNESKSAPVSMVLSTGL